MESFKQYLTESTDADINSYDNQALTTLGNILFISSNYVDKLTDRIDALNEKDNITYSQEEKLELYEMVLESFETIINTIQEFGNIQPIKAKVGSLNSLPDILSYYQDYFENLRNVIEPAAADTNSGDPAQSFREKRLEATAKIPQLLSDIKELVQKFGLTIKEDGEGWFGGDKSWVIKIDGPNLRGYHSYGSKIDTNFNTPYQRKSDINMARADVYEHALEEVRKSLGVSSGAAQTLIEDPKERLVSNLDDLTSEISNLMNSI